MADPVSWTVATQDPLVTAVGLAIIGVAIVAVGLAGKMLLTVAWRFSCRRQLCVAAITARPHRAGPAAALADSRDELSGPPTSPRRREADPQADGPTDGRPDRPAEHLLEGLDIDTLAEAAGAGAVAHHSARSLDDVFAAMRDHGWIALHDVILDGVWIHQALIGPGGAFAFRTRLPRWTMGDIAVANLQAQTLAWTLDVAEEDVAGVVVIPGSSEPPRRWYGPGAVSAVVVGEHQLVAWLHAQPHRIGRQILGQLAFALDQATAAARSGPHTLGNVHNG